MWRGYRTCARVGDGRSAQLEDSSGRLILGEGTWSRFNTSPVALVKRRRSDRERESWNSPAGMTIVRSPARSGEAGENTPSRKLEPFPDKLARTLSNTLTSEPHEPVAPEKLGNLYLASWFNLDWSDHSGRRIKRTVLGDLLGIAGTLCRPRLGRYGVTLRLDDKLGDVLMDIDDNQVVGDLG
jgi:hypothetical protein